MPSEVKECTFFIDSLFLLLLFENYSRPDATIDMHIFEFDRLLSQMAQDCLDSLPTSSPFSSNSSVLSFQINPQHRQSRSVIYDSSLPSKSTESSRKSIECLYMIPAMNKATTSLASHCHLIVEGDHRPKSALTENQNPTLSTISSSHSQQRFQSSIHKSSSKKMWNSEDDLMLAVQSTEPKINSLDNIDDNEDTLTSCENNKEHQLTNIQTLVRQFEQKLNSSFDYSNIETVTSNIHYATARTIIDYQEKQDKNELILSQESLSTYLPTQTKGIKKFVNNDFKRSTTQSQQKRPGK